MSEITEADYKKISYTKVNSFWVKISEIDKAIKALQEYKASLPKPHPHAHLMELYAKDAKETDRPWERWELCVRFQNGYCCWVDFNVNPSWNINTQYRRKQT